MIFFFLIRTTAAPVLVVIAIAAKRQTFPLLQRETTRTNIVWRASVRSLVCRFYNRSQNAQTLTSALFIVS